VYALTCAHPLRDRGDNNWCWRVTNEEQNEEVDCPAISEINRTRVKLRQDIIELRKKLMAEQEKIAMIHELECKLRMLDQCSEKRHFGRVLAMSYGEYRGREGGESVNLLDDWAILRVYPSRIGENLFPPVRGFDDLYDKVATIEVGKKVLMNGAVSGVREGIIMDRILSIADEHEHETLNWIVREKGWGEFSQAGDSGAGFGLEGGEAGGLILQGRVGLADDGQRFPFSIVSSLEDVLSRIREITGRRLILHVLGRDPPSPGPSRNRWTHRGTAPVSESRSRPSAP
jgi:hypothetical protein